MSDSRPALSPTDVLRERASIPATYDHRETGDRYHVDTRINNRHVSHTTMPDPFMHHRVVIGWRDLLRSLLRGKAEVVVTVGGDREIIEDVLELNADYLGERGSSRRREWDASVNAALAAHTGDVLVQVTLAHPDVVEQTVSLPEGFADAGKDG